MASPFCTHKRSPEVEDAFEVMTEEEFRRHFRLSKRTVRSLCDELDSIIGCQRASGLSTERKVLCALRFFATGSFQESVGYEEFIGMSQASVSDTIHEVAEAVIVLGRRRKLVDFPLTAAAKEEAKAAFARLGRIPGVLACVDGTLIAIEKPEGLSIADTASFMTRKGFYALNVMIVCDADLRILVIDPRFPGSCDDSWVWRRNPLWKCLASQLQPGEYVLGDSGYPLEPWLMIPVPGHPRAVSPEGLYNKEHTTMRNVVERCIEVLKSRFRCLQHYRPLLYRPYQAAAIVSACAALHNMALEAGEPLFDEDDDSGEAPSDPHQDDAEYDIYLKGRQQRDAVVSLFQCAQGMPGDSAPPAPQD
ncbi:putative nuclease HARBI1 [Rhipicephalus sanguineus]|uniref:putative nuclease HARBI1 n=1 Tax=Rhipicephalus sanguineus TaxID=34632 RepID=UPI001892D2AE|nr:putative nuclease HARBI1 [Rhipicephalus sanguineus]